MRYNPRKEWVVRTNAFPAIVAEDTFKQAQEHLYWLSPSKWKRGIYLINKTKRLIRLEIKQLLEQQGVNRDQIEYTIEKLPIAFSISFYRESVPHWCFSIDEKTRNYNHVLGISIELDQTEPMYHFFFIPTQDFNTINFLTFSASDEVYDKYSLTETKLQEEVLKMASILR